MAHIEGCGCGSCSGGVLPTGARGYNGWQPILSTVIDNVNLDEEDDYRVVLQLVGWAGGTGPTPTLFIGQYIGTTGMVSAIASAVNIRGAKGADGEPGADGTDATVTVNSVLGLNISGSVSKGCLDFLGNTLGDYLIAIIAALCELIASSGGGSVSYTNQQLFFSQFDGITFTGYTLTKANAISQSGATLSAALIAVSAPSFVVPSGVTSIQVELFGGGGTTGSSDDKGNALIVKNGGSVKLYSLQGDPTSITSTSGGISNCIVNLNGENGNPPSQPSPGAVSTFTGSLETSVAYQLGMGGVGGKGGKGATEGYGDGSSGTSGADGPTAIETSSNFPSSPADDGQWGAGGGAYGRQILTVTPGDIFYIYTFFNTTVGKHNNNSKVIISWN
jgi:hypothetical protein